MLHGLAREQAQQQERHGGAEAESEHGERDLTDIIALGGEDRGGAQRRADTRTPNCAEQEAEPELPGKARRGEIVGISARPIADRCGGERELLLQTRNQHYEADGYQEARRDKAEDPAIDSRGEADRRHEQADRGKGDSQPGGQRHWSQPLRAGSRTEHDRQQRQYAG